jgi:hypothetical protein
LAFAGVNVFDFHGLRPWHCLYVAALFDRSAVVGREQKSDQEAKGHPLETGASMQA